jgi:hypothetical protein
MAAAESNSAANFAQDFTMHTPNERKVEKQPLLPPVWVPLDRVGDPKEEPNLDALDSASISDELVVALY